jgi:parvulin-like peptidyl-prolyl isomerase
MQPSSLLPQLRSGQLSHQDLTNLLGRYRLMPQLYREMVIDEAIAAIECPANDIPAAQSAFYTAQGITTEIQRQTWLKQQHLSPEHAAWLALRHWRIEQFKQVTWGHQVASHFMADKSQLDQVVYSVLRLDRFDMAQELFFRLKAQEQDFAAAVRQYSQGPEAAVGGLIGPIPLSQPHPLIASKLQTATIGQVIAPFQLDKWVILLRLEQLIPATFDAAARQTMLDGLYETWLQAAVDALMSP